MLVKLPRQCSGREIVKAFKNASTFQEGSDKEWRAEEFVDEIVYIPGSVKQMIQRVGVCAHLFSLRKKWGLFGKKVWKPNHSISFMLKSVDLSLLHYKEITVEVELVSFREKRKISDPRSLFFNDIRPQFEKILGNFYDQL